MAQKKKASSPKQAAADKPKVTRIKATDSSATPKASVKPQATAKAKTKSQPRAKKAAKSDKGSELGYFKGAWYELRQVRWPNRRTTWALTLAVLLFTAFFVVLIVLLDYGFQWVFDQVLG